jgi:predicted metalloendopeptidase
LTIAYRAYQLALDGEEARVIDELTGDQRFLLAWAQAWPLEAREQYQTMLLDADTLNPAAFRVNEVVRNLDAWYAAFDVQSGDALYLAPADRVRIW